MTKFEQIAQTCYQEDESGGRGELDINLLGYMIIQQAAKIIRQESLKHFIDPDNYTGQVTIERKVKEYFEL
jgi:hypothetical protein